MDSANRKKKEFTIEKAKPKKKLEVETGYTPVEDKRTFIMDQGDIKNLQYQELEAVSKANFDNKGPVSTQIWYDQLRGTDDGRFSSPSEFQKYDHNFVKNKTNKENQLLKDRILKSAR